MATLIRIDRASVRKNPDAGRTEWTVPTTKSAFRTVDEVRGGMHTTMKQQAVGDPAKGEWVTLETHARSTGAKDRPPQMQGWIEQDHEQFTTLPAPDWLYDYEPTFVKCGNCGKPVRHDQIERDEIGDDLCDVCPHCNSIDTFDYELERIGDVVKELIAAKAE